MSLAESTKQENAKTKSGVKGGLSLKGEARPFVNSFVEHLVHRNIITEEIALQVSAVKQTTNGKRNKSLVETIADDFKIPREALYDEVAQFYSFRLIDIHDRNARRLQPSSVNKLLSGLPESAYRLALKYKVLPFEVADNQPDKLLIVTPYPSEREIHEVGRSFPYKKFEVCYMKEKDWAELWRQVTLDKQQVAGGGATADDTYEENEAELDSVLDREINRSQLIALVENVFADAVRVGASDVHIIPRGARKTTISFRIDGDLTEWYTIEDARAEAVIAVVKGSGLNLDRFERMAAQDGAAQKIVDNQIIRFRISVLPILSRELGGKFESVVIRILKDADASVSLETIGFDEYSLGMFREAISQPHGMIILTGPTGCGKSTTLVAALRAVMNPTMNTISVEDPVEYLIEGARQVKLNHKLSFEDALRAILRHDPDVVMVGEIRDRITADIAIKLANTGHLAFSTLHTNDAPSAVSRLFKIGVEPFLMAQAMNIVVAQRLVRKLCDRCKAPAQKPNDVFLAKVGFTQEEAESLASYRAVGCANCIGGFKGRKAIHETLFFTPEIRDIILDSGDRIDTNVIRASAIRHGMQTLRRSGLELVKKGITTIEEIVANTANG
ncbi:MAG TPA: pilus assembly protein PilB [Bacteroidetes bacterium]|nr:pilus assembly protein PilB [Bacteroidota bacterium]